MISLNGHVIVPTIFPDNTSQVWKIEDSALADKDLFRIDWDFASEAEIMHLLQLKDLLEIKYPGRRCELWMSYLPYGRQDKEVKNDQTFALFTFSWLLDILQFDKIYCFDPHSDVCEKNVDNFTPLWPIQAVTLAIIETKADLLCYPDQGATKKYGSMFSKSYLHAAKARDPVTGEITGMELYYSHIQNPEGKTILIVDDICDGGATFIKLAYILFEHGAKEVNLYVSHGIFSKGLQVLKDAGINKIYTKYGEVK